MKWRFQPLCEVADSCLGKMLDARKNKGEPKPYLANINVRWGSFDLENLREMRFEEREKERYGLRSGDIVMCEGGEPGRCAIWKDDAPEMMIQKALHRIRPYAFVDSRFLFFYFLKTGRNGGFDGLFTGSTIKHLTGKNLAKLRVPVPPLPIQNRIADILSAYDDLIENNKRRMQLMEEAARQLYREWFVRLRFPGHEHTKITNGLPEGWVRRPLGELCAAIKDTVLPDQVDSGTPYIGLEHMPRRSISLCEWGKADDVASMKFRFIEGDILFGKIRPYFHKVGTAFTSGITSSDAIVIRSNESDIQPLLLCLMSSDEFVADTAQSMKEGSKMPRADWKLMQQFPVIFPSGPLLNEFLGCINDIIGQLKTLTLQNQKLRAARDLLLPKLMNGEIAV